MKEFFKPARRTRLLQRPMRTRVGLSVCLAVVALAFAASQTPLIYGQGLAAEEARQAITLVDGLQVSLLASEPDVAQTIFVKCDDRGRVWTIQYLQYPNPAGLQRVKVDRWSRTVYDRVPEPPPHGPRGADRITICEDVDGDGRADRFKDFVDGLNLVTGVAFGDGGVYVLNVPYLLFYPDRNRDDVPDGDPEALLSGFGMEDAQSLSNHLTWGPDGWLYGVNGSTTTCNIRGIEFQSGVWRYHPKTREFELFCEGGLNGYGLTFDRHGELFYSMNGAPFIHGMQGAYYYKSFGKHGPLHNLYAYHFFPQLKCDLSPGGPPTGGTIYRGDSLPARFRDTFIAGNFLGHTCSWWNLHSEGSTFSATYGGVLLDAHDTWFGPTDMCAGPDGSLYVSDFHDQRTAHPDPDANWDRRNGRIYKISAQGRSPSVPINVAELSTDKLVDLLTHANGWYADQARVALATRGDASVRPPLMAMAKQTVDEQQALQGLWGLQAIGALDEPTARDMLAHKLPYMRYWAVRLLGDRRKVSPETAEALIALSQRETIPAVVGQLAASAKRLPPHIGLPMALSCLQAECSRSDERIGWLVWWALEHFSMQIPDRLIAELSTPEALANPLSRENALRLVRRWGADGSLKGYDACAAMIAALPQEITDDAIGALRTGLSERAVGLHGVGQGGLFNQMAEEANVPEMEKRSFDPVAGALLTLVERYTAEHSRDVDAVELALRAGLAWAPERLQELAAEKGQSESQRVAQLALMRELPSETACPLAQQFIAADQTENVVLAALDVIDAVGDDARVVELLDRYASLGAVPKSRLRDLAFSRPQAAREFLLRVDTGMFDPVEIPVAQLSQLATHHDDEIDASVRKHWGQVGPGTSEEKLATMRRFNNDLRAGTGDPAQGKLLFVKHCGICHLLHGEGAKIGPDLTSANRQDQAALLGNLVDPSAVIRRDYTAYIVETDGGRTITGMLAEQDAAKATVIDAQNRKIEIPRDEIVELKPSPVSLMPERLLDALTPQELRDLFSYLKK